MIMAVRVRRVSNAQGAQRAGFEEEEKEEEEERTSQM
jgi:hypothetical protein